VHRAFRQGVLDEKFYRGPETHHLPDHAPRNFFRLPATNSPLSGPHIETVEKIKKVTIVSVNNLQETFFIIASVVGSNSGMHV
jgi:hypothetical protein